MTVLVIISTALSGVLANSIAFALHEVVGHGLMARTLGGRFLGFFISPTAAFAETAVDDRVQLWVSAAGTPVNLISGLLALMYLTRRTRADGVDRLWNVGLWHFAHVSLVMQLSYVGGLPLAMWLLDQPPQGDWVFVFDRLSIHPVLPAIVILPLAITAAAELTRLATGVTLWRYEVAGRLTMVKSYLLLTAAPLAVLVLYAIAERPWASARDYFELKGLAATPLTVGLAGAVFAQWRRSRNASSLRSDAPDRTPLEHRVLTRATIYMLACLLAVTMFFGPTIPLRRGVAVQQSTADDYLRSAHDVRVELRFTVDHRATLVIASRPVETRGSPYLQRLSEQLARLGPSETAARQFTQFFAERNLGLPNMELSEAPQRTADEWRWAASSRIDGTSIRIQIWPNIYNESSRIVELSIAGMLRSFDPQNVPGLLRTNDGVVWRRPHRMEAPLGFIVQIS